MGLSIFFAKLLGVYLLIVALELLLRRKEFEGAVKDFASSKGLILFSGSMSLLFGITIAVSHPVYEFSWRGLITFLGYLLILRGVWRIACPSRMQKNLVQVFHQGYWFIFIIVAVIGVVLTNAGFNIY